MLTRYLSTKNRGYILGGAVIYSHMKKPKTIKPFKFKDISHKDMADILDKELPINIKYNEDLINRIHSKYPFVSKTETAIVVKTIFQSIRELLVLGKIINFHNLFFNTKLYFFDYNKNGNKMPHIKVKSTTSPKLRKIL
jgi:hypothetical protein